MGTPTDTRHFIAAFDQAAMLYLRKRMEHRQQAASGEDVAQLEDELTEAHNALLSAFSDLTEYAVEQGEDIDEETLSLVEKDIADVPPFAMQRALKLMKGEAEVGQL